MSRKLSGAQYRCDARNVEALAAQMALQTWRTNLLGVQFENYSDHDSLKYLFKQKEPSQRISRLCEFMADFNFTEVHYVPGPDNVVPDFYHALEWMSKARTGQSFVPCICCLRHHQYGTRLYTAYDRTLAHRLWSCRRGGTG